MASVLASTAELTVHGWIRSHLEEHRYIPDIIQNMCLLFYGVVYKFNDQIMHSLNRWKILPFTKATKANLTGKGWPNSNIFLDPIMNVESGQYELKIQFLKKHEGMFNNFVIGICPIKAFESSINSNFCYINGIQSFGMCASGDIIPNQNKSMHATVDYNGVEIKDGDVIHVIFNTDDMRMRFGVNELELEWAFTNIPKCEYVFAFASFYPCNIEILDV